IATFPQGALEIEKTIFITPTINPNIIFDRNYICQPGVINFSASSNGTISNYDWDFGDESGVVSTPASATSHTFAAYGSYTVILKAIDAGGCFGQDTVKIDVKKIPVSATVSPPSGCIPANVSFTANDTLPLNSTVSSYSWDFGDGSSPVSTTSNTTSHSYVTVKSYRPNVTITTSEGCVDTFNFPFVAYGTPPSNAVAYAKDSLICGSQTAVFVAKATNANSYFWDFGDGINKSVTDTLVDHKYTTLGVKTVKVTPYFNGCAGATKSFQIEITGVIALYQFLNKNCPDKTVFSFLNYSSGNITSTLWEFGDGTPSASTNIVHNYPPMGEFITKLTVSDVVTGCVDTFSQIIYTATPVLVNTDTSICKNTNTTFTIANNYTNTDATYTWNVMGKIVSTGLFPTITLNSNILGSFNNFVSIRNGAQYCRDTVYLDHPILVRGPYLDFTQPANICFGDSVTIINNSKPFVPAETVSLWYWNYGNSSSNDTVFQPLPVQYNAPRSYNVKLTGIDINGCRDSLISRVTVNPLPFLQVLPGTDTLCRGRSDSLFAYHSDSILWSPSTRLSCTTCDTVIANPTVTTQYYVTATTPFNCSIQDSILVNVIQPFTATPLLNTQYICQGESVTLDMDPKDKIIIWSPAAGLSNVNIYNPVATPAQTTTYTATLADSTGCFTSSADITITLKTNPTVEAGPNRVVSYSSPFNIVPLYSSNIASYLWTPSAFLNCSNCPNPSGIALNSETYTIKVTSDSGCTATDAITINIECKAANILMPKAFTPNNDNLNDFYYPITRGIKTVLQFTVFNREGKIMYQARNFSPNDKTFAWDGNFKGKKQSATAYVYVMEALCEQGEKLTKSDSFLLLR
ncbi:MAG: PKD domain-containing protein, partial [Ferruginibacter sp.]